MTKPGTRLSSTQLNSCDNEELVEDQALSTSSSLFRVAPIPQCKLKSKTEVSYSRKDGSFFTIEEQLFLKTRGLINSTKGYYKQSPKVANIVKEKKQIISRPVFVHARYFDSQYQNFEGLESTSL